MLTPVFLKIRDHTASQCGSCKVAQHNVMATSVTTVDMATSVTTVDIPVRVLIEQKEMGSLLILLGPFAHKT